MLTLYLIQLGQEDELNLERMPDKFQNLRKNSNVLNFESEEFRKYGVYRQTLIGNIMLKLSLILKKA